VTDKEKAWKAFSIYIRTKWAIIQTGSPDYAVCITCERQYQTQLLHAGHMFPGRMNSVLFSEKFIFPQCPTCNCFIGGVEKQVEAKLRKVYGDVLIDSYRRKTRRVIPDRNMDWVGRELRYKRKLKLLLKRYYNGDKI